MELSSFSGQGGMADTNQNNLIGWIDIGQDRGRSAYSQYINGQVLPQDVFDFIRATGETLENLENQGRLESVVNGYYLGQSYAEYGITTKEETIEEVEDEQMIDFAADTLGVDIASSKNHRMLNVARSTLGEVFSELDTLLLSTDEKFSHEVLKKEIKAAFGQNDTEKIEKVNLSRRKFLQFGIASAVIGMGLLASPNFNSKIEEPIGESTGELGAERVEHEAVHNPDHISTVDITSAAFVSGIFGTIIGSQLAGGLITQETFENNAKPIAEVHQAVASKIFNKEKIEENEINETTVNRMATAFGLRLAVLGMDAQLNTNEEERIASEHAYEHEKEELKNLAVAMGLVGMSELTSYIETPTIEDAVNVHADEIIRKFGIDEEQETVRVGNLNIRKEEILEYLSYDDDFKTTYKELTEVSDVDRTKLIQAKIEDYILALKAEGTIDRYENSILENGHVNRHALELDIKTLEDEIADDLMTNNFLALMTAPFGLTFTSAGIVSKRLIPASRKFFELEYLKNIRELSRAEIDKESLTQLQEDAKQKAIQTMNNPAGLVNLSVATAGNIVGPVLFADPPNIFYLINHGAKEWLENSVEGLGLAIGASTIEYAMFLQQNKLAKFNKEALNQLGNGFMQAKDLIAPTLLATGVNLSNLTFKDLGLKIDEALFNIPSSIKTTSGDAISGIWDMIMNRFTKNNISKEERMAKRKEKIVAGDVLMQEVGAMDRSEDEVEFVLPFENPMDVMYSTVGEILGEKEAEEVKSKIGKYVDIITSKIEQSDSPEKGAEAAWEFIQQTEILENLDSAAAEQLKHQISHIVHSKYHYEHHNLSHSALDVRNALLTQLFAVGSLQVVVKKTLGLDQPEQLTPKKAKTLAASILGIVGLSSSVADNVAAMLFGINVLEKIGEKTLGENYSPDSQLAKTLRKYAFFMSVFAGSLSKIGNGPNMSFERIKDIKRDDTKNLIEILTKKNPLADSFANTWAWGANAGLYSLGINRIFNQIDLATEGV